MPGWLAGPGMTVGAFCVLAACLAAGALLRWRSFGRLLAETGTRPLVLMAAMTLLHVWLVRPRLPHTVWHEHHPGAALESVVSGPWTSAGRTLHGPGSPVTLRLLRDVLPGRPSVFTVNYAVSLASAWLLFLLVGALAGSWAPGLAAAAMLILLPARLRLAVSETEFVALEAFLLATSLFLVLWRRERDHRLLGLGLLAAALLGQTRAEMLGLAPLLLGLPLILLRGAWPAGAAGSPAVWASAGAAVLLSVPRAASILWWAGDRAGLAPLSGLSLSWAGLGKLNIFLDPSLTPPAFMGLCAIGLAFLAARSRRLALAWTGQAGLLSLYYLGHVDCLSLQIRTGLASQYLFIGLAGYGAWRLVGILPASWARTGGAAVCAVVLAAPLPYRGFLAKLYSSQAEFGFIQAQGSKLPEAAVVAHLSVEEAWSLAPVRGPTTNHAKLLTLSAPGSLKVMDLSSFLDDVRPARSGARPEGPALYYYEGLNCLTPVSHEARRVEGKDYRHPLCRTMERRFRLTPVALSAVTDESLAPEAPRPGGGLIGFFKVEGVMLRERVLEELAGEDALRRDEGLTAAGSGRAKAGLRLAGLLAAAGARRASLGLAASVAASSEEPGDWAASGWFLLKSGEPAGAAALLRKAGLPLLAARAAVQAGDRDAARRDAAQVVAESLCDEDAGRLAVLLQEFGEYGRALALLDRLVRRRPWRARFVSDRAVVLGLLGRREASWRDAKAAVEADPAYVPAALSLASMADTRLRRAEAAGLIGRALGPRADIDSVEVRDALSAAREELLRPKKVPKKILRRRGLRSERSETRAPSDMDARG